MAPGQNESAGHKKRAPARPGDSYLKGALGIAALSISRSKNNYLAARYRRIAARRGHLRAIVAIEHVILTAIWHMLTDNVAYRDLGADHYQLSHPDQIKRRALKQLTALGYDVHLEEAS